jgi:ATP-dependent DNA ligase
VRLGFAQGNVYKCFGELCTSMADCLNAESIVLNGEIVHLGKDGRPEFYSLLHRRSPQYFCAFDVVWLNRSAGFVRCFLNGRNPR